MINLKNLILKPNLFFYEIKRTNNIGLKKNIFYGMAFGIISQFFYYILFILSLKATGIIFSNMENNINIKFNKEIEIEFYILLFFMIVVLIPIITISIRNFIGWILLKLLRVKGSKLKEINKIVCFSMIANFWIVFSLIGFIIGFIHLFVLTYVGLRNFYKIKIWKVIILSFIISLMNFQPFFYFF